jgi:hypothetical protein
MGENSPDKGENKIFFPASRLTLLISGTYKSTESADGELHTLGGGFSGRIFDRESVGRGFPGRDVQATGVRGPDSAGGRIELDGLGIGDVVAELCRFSGVYGARRNVEASDGQFRTTQLFDGEAVFFSALLGLALLYFPLVFLAGFVARIENIRDVKKDAKNQERRVEKWILEGGLRRRGRFGNHGANQVVFNCLQLLSLTGIGTEGKTARAHFIYSPDSRFSLRLSHRDDPNFQTDDDP